MFTIGGPRLLCGRVFTFLTVSYSRLLPRRKLDNIMSNSVSRYDGGRTKVDLTI